MAASGDLRSLLIVKLSSLGDVVHTLPAARHLREAFPSARLGWAVQDAYADVLRGQSWLDELIVWRRGTPRSYFDFIRRLRAGRWEAAADFQGIFRSGLVTRLSGARRRVGFAPAKEFAHWFYNDAALQPKHRGHAIEWYLELAAAISGRQAPLPLDRPYLRRAAPAEYEEPMGAARFPLQISSSDEQAAETWLAAQGFVAGRDRLVILCPDCRREANRWPAGKFARLAARLLADGLSVAVVGGLASQPLCTRISEQVAGPLWRADGRFGLRASAALLSKAAVVVTGDSGPMHLAVAVGTRVVALLGPTDPGWTGPYSSTAIVLTRRLPCSPCKSAGPCPLKYDPPRCMEELGVDEAYHAVHRQLGAGRGTRTAGSRQEADRQEADRRLLYCLMPPASCLLPTASFLNALDAA